MKRFLFCILLSPIIIYQVLADFIGIFLAKALLLIGKILIPHQTKLVISYTWSGVINAFWFKNPFLGLCVLYYMFWFIFGNGFNKEVANFIGIPLFFIYMMWSANLLTFAILFLTSGGIVIILILAVIFNSYFKFSSSLADFCFLITIIIRQVGLFFHIRPIIVEFKNELKGELIKCETKEEKAFYSNFGISMIELFRDKSLNVCIGILPSIFLIFALLPKLTIEIYAFFDLSKSIALLVYMYALLVSLRLAGGFKALAKMFERTRELDRADYTGVGYDTYFFRIPLLREVVIDRWIRAVTLHYFVAIFVLGYIISFIAKNDSMSYIANLSYADMLSYGKMWLDNSLSYTNELYENITPYFKKIYDYISSYIAFL